MAEDGGSLPLVPSPCRSLPPVPGCGAGYRPYLDQRRGGEPRSSNPNRDPLDPPSALLLEARPQAWSAATPAARSIPLWRTLESSPTKRPALYLPARQGELERTPDHRRAGGREASSRDRTGEPQSAQARAGRGRRVRGDDRRRARDQPEEAAAQFPAIAGPAGNGDRSRRRRLRPLPGRAAAGRIGRARSGRDRSAGGDRRRLCFCG